MTTNRLQFYFVTAFTMGAVAATARAQAAAPPAPAQQVAPQTAGQQVAPSAPWQQVAPQASGLPTAAPAQPGAQMAPVAGQPYSAPPGAAPTPQYPAGQPYPGQPYPGQPYPGQPYPGQPYPAQPYPAQPYSGQPYSGQPYPGQSYPAQPYPGQPYPGQPYPAQPYPGYPPPALNTTVHIDANDREATLFQHTGSSAFVGYSYRGAVIGGVDFWQRVCRAPCDQPVDTNASYSIRGNGIVPSALFSFPPGPAKVKVQAGHSGPRIGGLLLTTMGGATFAGGAGVLAMGALFKSIGNPTESSLSRSAGSYMAAGGIAMAVGAGALVGGIVLLIKTRTQVQINGEMSAQLHLAGGRSLYVNAHGLAF